MHPFGPNKDSKSSIVYMCPWTVDALKNIAKTSNMGHLQKHFLPGRGEHSFKVLSQHNKRDCHAGFMSNMVNKSSSILPKTQTNHCVKFIKSNTELMVSKIKLHLKDKHNTDFFFSSINRDLIMSFTSVGRY